MSLLRGDHLDVAPRQPAQLSFVLERDLQGAGGADVDVARLDGELGDRPIRGVAVDGQFAPDAVREAEAETAHLHDECELRWGIRDDHWLLGGIGARRVCSESGDEGEPVALPDLVGGIEGGEGAEACGWCLGLDGFGADSHYLLRLRGLRECHLRSCFGAAIAAGAAHDSEDLPAAQHHVAGSGFDVRVAQLDCAAVREIAQAEGDAQRQIGVSAFEDQLHAAGVDCVVPVAIGTGVADDDHGSLREAGDRGSRCTHWPVGEHEQSVFGLHSAHSRGLGLAKRSAVPRA